MKTTLSKVKEWVDRQINSYNIRPSSGDFDKGYLCALRGITGIIEQDGRYAKSENKEGEKDE